MTDVDGLVFIDRLSLAFPIKGYDERRFDQISTRLNAGAVEVERLSTSVRWKPEGADKPDRRGSAFLGVQYRAGSGFFAKVEANPSPWFESTPYEPMPFARLGDAVDRMAEIVTGAGVEPSVPSDDWSVRRVDFARPFTGVADVGFMLRGLQPLRRPYAKRNVIWSDPTRRGAQTLLVGSGSGSVRCYDRWEAYGDKVRRGDVQWEAQAMRPWLERFGVGRVRDLTAWRCQALVADRWNWSRMGDVVMGAVGVVQAVDRIVAAGGYEDERTGEWVPVSPTVATRLLGMLVAESAGVRFDASRQTTTTYERLKRNLGVVPSAELFDSAHVEVASRLDFGEGIEVAA